MKTAPRPVAVLPIRVLPSLLKLPVWVNTEPSDPTVVKPMREYVVPSEDTLVVSETFWMVSPWSENANLPNICQNDIVSPFHVVRWMHPQLTFRVDASAWLIG